MTGVAERVEIPRDRWGRPLITPVTGGKPVPYARASSFGDVLDDRTNLEKWKVRMAVHGLTRRPDLYLQATTTPLENRAALNKIADAAAEHAGGSQKATIGTVLHELTERIDRGVDPGPVPAEYAADLAAYRAATGRYSFEHIERFMVCDELEVAGTPDRLGYDESEGDEAGVGPLRVLDLKTGGSNGFLDKHAVQLAIYAHSVLYDPATGERTPVDVAQDYGLIFHLPAGQGEFGLYRLDLAAGWDGALLAADVRRWRRRKGICTPVNA